MRRYVLVSYMMRAMNSTMQKSIATSVTSHWKGMDIIAGSDIYWNLYNGHIRGRPLFKGLYILYIRGSTDVYKFPLKCITRLGLHMQSVDYIAM